MTQARAVIKAGMDFPHLLDRIADHEDLVTAGVNSGEMIRIALSCERHLGRALTDDELSRLATVAAVERLLTQARED
jgi:aryl carrier-like protein